MTRFTQKSFSVGAPSTKTYADNWERIFGPKTCPVHPGDSERKSIGLSLQPGQTEDEAYAQWALARGSVCICVHARASRCVECDELKSDPEDFGDGLRCKTCVDKAL